MIKQMRQQLVTDLTAADLKVYDTWPAAGFIPPAVLVRHPVSATYVSAGQLVGEFEVAQDVIVAVRRGKSEEELADLDDLIEAVLSNTVDWAFRGVDSPGLINIQGAEFPGAVIHLAKQHRLY